MAGDTVQEIKNRLNIQEVVAPYVKLKRAGRSMVGLCPFHKEKTPSFHVSLERGSYHCFGCGEGGDMFSFVEKTEGVDFKGALKILAEKAGVAIVYDPRAKEKSDKRERLYEALARAAQWYAAQLNVGHPMSNMSEALAYAKKRGLREDSIKSWGLGYAPDAWRDLLEALGAQGFSVQELLAAGLVKEADGKPGTYYDRFRARLMFPIKDGAGRVIAFTGRALPSPAPANEGAIEPAKYLNSPETDLYHKSEVMFGLDRAKDALRTRGFALLVEGQMDVIHAHQAGFENAVALSGTAFSPRHAALLSRYSENLLLVLDADAAGLLATARSAQIALSEGMRVKAAALPAGKDPADLISGSPEGAREFARRVKEARPVVDFFLGALAAREPDQHRLVASAERVVLPLIRAIKSPMEREHFVQSAARALGLSGEAVRETLGRFAHSEEKSAERRAPSAPPAAARAPRLSAREAREALLLAAIHAYPESALARRIETEYGRITGAHEPPQGAPAESALFDAERFFGEAPSESAADELLDAFETAVIREAYQEAVRELRRAETAGDAASVKRAHEACAALSGRLAARA